MSAEIVQLCQFRADPGAAVATRYREKHPVLAARPERDRRKKMWRQAEAVYRFYDALCAIAKPANVAHNECGLMEAKAFAHYREDLVRLYEERRKAARQLLLTPVPSMIDFKTKRQMRWKVQLDTDIAGKIDALLDADEAWLLAHAGHRTKRRPS
jgi:hypothetical protein